MKQISCPRGGESQPESRSVSVLPAGQQAVVTFTLQGSSDFAKNVGFSLHSKKGLTIGWAARVNLAEASKKVATEFKVHGNHPNPFASTTTITYNLPQDMMVKLTVFNIIGQKVATLVNGQQSAGLQNISWDASGVASGTYIYQIIAKAGNGQHLPLSERWCWISSYET